jgi:hypothetical protein
MSEKKMKTKYRVVFNNDPENYEEFDDFESAKKFANRYANCKIVTHQITN